MFAKILCLGATLAASISYAQTEDATLTPADIIKGYYSNYRLMEDPRLRSELLILWISTAGDGDFDIKEQISAGCKKLATAAADVWQDLPTLELAAPLIDSAIGATMVDVRTTDPAVTLHPMEKMCQHLERSLQLDPAVNTKFLRFQRQPKATPPELAANTRQISGNASIVVNDFYVALLAVPRVGQLMAHGIFVAYLRSNNCALVDYQLARAIVQLSKKPELQTQVQLTYEKGLYDVVQFLLEILDRDKNTAIVPIFQIANGALMARVRDSFQKDPKMWAEVENTQKVINSTICKSTQ